MPPAGCCAHRQPPSARRSRRHRRAAPRGYSRQACCCWLGSAAATPAGELPGKQSVGKLGLAVTGPCTILQEQRPPRRQHERRRRGGHKQRCARVASERQLAAGWSLPQAECCKPQFNSQAHQRSAKVRIVCASIACPMDVGEAAQQSAPCAAPSSNHPAAAPLRSCGRSSRGQRPWRERPVMQHSTGAAKAKAKAGAGVRHAACSVALQRWHAATFAPSSSKAPQEQRSQVTSPHLCLHLWQQQLREVLMAHVVCACSRVAGSGSLCCCEQQASAVFRQDQAPVCRCRRASTSPWFMQQRLNSRSLAPRRAAAEATHPIVPQSPER
jgi:hypothetical protein